MPGSDRLSDAQLDELFRMVEWSHDEIKRLRTRDMLAITFHNEVKEAFRIWTAESRKKMPVSEQTNLDFVLAVSNALVKIMQDEKEMGVQHVEED